jgi:signal transduction histidine kinase
MQQVKIKLEKLPEDVIVELDVFRTQQVVINLLSNALKFSKALDIIYVKIKLSPFE